MLTEVQSSRFPLRSPAMLPSCSHSSDVVSVGQTSQPRLQSLRCAVYVFVGSVAVGPAWWRIIPGTIVGIVGVGYCVLEFIPSIEPPANMRDADAGWGAEQV